MSQKPPPKQFVKTPIKGTKARKIKENIKIGIIIFFKKDVFTEEIQIIITKAKKVKTRCFVKKK